MSCRGAYNTYDISDPVELLAVLDLASSETPYDPSVVRVQILTPNRILSTYVYGTDADLIRNSAGNYSLITYPTMSGFHTYRWEMEDSTGGAHSGAEEAQFLVRYSRIVAGASSGNGGGGGSGGAGVDGGSP